MCFSFSPNLHFDDSLSEFLVPLLFQSGTNPTLQRQNLLHYHTMQQIVQQQLLRITHEYFRVPVLDVVCDDRDVVEHELLDVCLRGRQPVRQQNPILIHK